MCVAVARCLSPSSSETTRRTRNSLVFRASLFSRSFIYLFLIVVKKKTCKRDLLATVNRAAVNTGGQLSLRDPYLEVGLLDRMIILFSLLFLEPPYGFPQWPYHLIPAVLRGLGPPVSATGILLWL